jgi:hypothetical protein
MNIPAQVVKGFKIGMKKNPWFVIRHLAIPIIAGIMILLGLIGSCLSSLYKPARSTGIPIQYYPDTPNTNASVAAPLDMASDRKREIEDISSKSAPKVEEATPQLEEEFKPTASTETSSLDIASSKSLSSDDLASKSAWQLTVMRNYPYAKHGYRFQEERLYNYFKDMTWYRPRIDDQREAAKYLSTLEASNVRFIFDYQNRNNLRLPPPSR